MEVVCFELTQADGIFVIFLLSVFSPLQIAVLTLETLGPPFPSRKACLDVLILGRGDWVRGVDVR